MRAVLLASLLLAGCVTPASDPSASTPPPTTAGAAASDEPEPIAIGTCTVLEALAKMPPASLAAFVPEGFEPLDDAGGTFAILGGARCPEAGDRAFVAIQVRPTDPALLGEGIGRYYWEPEHDVVPRGSFADRMAALRANVTQVEVELQNAPTGAGLRVTGDGWEHVASMPAGAMAPGPLPITYGLFREYFAVDGGYGYFQARFREDPTSPFFLATSTFTTGEGTMAREVFGAEVTTTAAVGELAYDDAVIGFVPWNGTSRDGR